VKQLLQVYEKYGCSVTSIDTVKETELSLNGILTGQLVALTQSKAMILKVTDTVEKPDVQTARQRLKVKDVGLKDDEYLCYFGIEILTPKIFEFLEKNYKDKRLTQGELQLRDSMGDIMKTEGMYGLVVQGKRHDTGMPHVYANTMSVFDTISLKFAKVK
jgi:UTP--glucose-1-phosphate uridylyltransferase